MLSAAVLMLAAGLAWLTALANRRETKL